MKFEQPAPAGTVFTADAFEGQIGTDVPVNIEGGSAQTGRLVAAKVADGGQSVEMTIDVDVTIPPYGGGSFGLR
ncbi:hypothetical protein GCM10011583_18050 [Streptomyces camponoticapitis]|uniref:Uncharacterized protein n=2 Tax=Streptomyces camponoticapitis TaxID=1616125 RepID=A0ABQ2E2U1_9ACTN|nr:hypothetical protein GCM10011583_18050 [Streptomyces camponoticapitis]